MEGSPGTALPSTAPTCQLGAKTVVLWGWQAVQAAQITFEDYFMADLDIAPLKVALTATSYTTIIMYIMGEVWFL